LPAAANASALLSYAVDHVLDPATKHQVVLRWSPCQMVHGIPRTHYITVRVNDQGVAGRVTLVREALGQLTAASGLHFRYLGRTSYVPHNAIVHYRSGPRAVYDAAQQRRSTGAELVIAWASGRQANLLTPAEAGAGVAGWSANPAAALRIVEAGIVMRTGVPLRPGFSGGASVGGLLLHELGHAVGLKHSTNTAEIMFPTLGSWTPRGYATGDRVGLRKVGRAAGCFTTPAAAPADPRAQARAAGVSVTG
jgi:hypothetical protein